MLRKSNVHVYTMRDVDKRRGTVETAVYLGASIHG